MSSAAARFAPLAPPRSNGGGASGAAAFLDSYTCSTTPTTPVGGGVSGAVEQAAAGRARATDGPASLLHLAAPSMMTWEAAIRSAPDGDTEFEILRAASLRFLENDWLGVALAAGWDELEIWGCFPSPQIEMVKRRGDCLGLVPALILGMGCSIECIDGRQAIVTRARTGSRLVHRRELPGRQWALPWWTPIATTLEQAA